MAYEIKARTSSEIVDGAFHLYRSHFSTFLGAAVATTVPAQLVVALVNLALTGTMTIVPTQAAGLGQFWLAFLVTMPVTISAYILQNALLTIAISDAYLGRPVSVRAAWHGTMAALGPLIGATILTGLGISLGLLLLIVPGILFMINWLFTVQAITVEGCRTKEAMDRSKRLAAGRRGRLGLLLLLWSIISMAINFATGAVIPDSVGGLPLLGSFLQQIPTLLLAPLYPAVVTLAYFDARVRTEAFDLEMLARGIGGTGPSVASVAAPTV